MIPMMFFVFVLAAHKDRKSYFGIGNCLTNKKKYNYKKILFLNDTTGELEQIQ